MKLSLAEQTCYLKNLNTQVLVIMIHMKNIYYPLAAVLLILLSIAGCKQDDPFKKNDTEPVVDSDGNSYDWTYSPTFYMFETPQGFPPPNLPADNPLTEEGIKLGRMLFYDPILSGDSTLSCAGCHNQAFAFTDNGKRFSTGIDGIAGTRNSMPIFNLAWSDKFFWDGRAANLTEQAQMPVVDPIEMHDSWSANLDELRAHPDYPRLFYEAFEVLPEDITPEYAGRALEQFMLTIVSADSKFDKNLRNETGGNPALELTIEELRGAESMDLESGSDCFHCHGSAGVGGQGGNIVFMELSPSGQFQDNGLQDAPTIGAYGDPGLGAITGNPADYGKFKIPSLRNLAFTAPYMHDGRFQTLEEVIEHYSTGLHFSVNVDERNLQFVRQGGVQMTQQEKDDLLAFLMTLNDYEFIEKEEFSNPFK